MHPSTNHPSVPPCEQPVGMNRGMWIRFVAAGSWPRERRTVLTPLPSFQSELSLMKTAYRFYSRFVCLRFRSLEFALIIHTILTAIVLVMLAIIAIITLIIFQQQVLLLLLVILILVLLLVCIACALLRRRPRGSYNITCNIL